MKTVNTILGSGALLLASNAIANAQSPLLAGPLPVDAGFGAGSSVTCSATDVSPGFSPEFIGINIYDATFHLVSDKLCSGLTVGQSCASEATLISPQFGGPPSPFICIINAEDNLGNGAAVRGSICGTAANPINGLPGSPYCLQALLSNGMSGGWGPP